MGVGNDPLFFMQKLEIFPIKLYEGRDETFPDYQEDLINYFLQFKEEHESVSVSNRGGFQSTPFLFNVPSFHKFAPLVWAALKPYFDQLIDDITATGFSSTLTLSNLWVNVNPPGTYNVEHTHPHSIYSGVMWIKAPQNCGNFVLTHPNKHNVYASDFVEYEIVPEEGKIVVFPSHVPHSVNMNDSDTARISISFNITAT